MRFCIQVCFRMFEKSHDWLGLRRPVVLWKTINTVTPLGMIHSIRYSMMVHQVAHVSAVWRGLINPCSLWLVKTMIDFSGSDRWEPSPLMVQNGMPSVLISTHWVEKKSICWIAWSIFDSRVMELSFFLSQIKIVLPFPRSFLPSSAILKRVINLARWQHYSWNNLTVSFSIARSN